MDTSTQDELLESLGSVANLWTSLRTFARDTYGLDGEVTGPDGSGRIEVRYRRSGRSLFTMLPQPRSLRVQIVIGPTIYEAVQHLGLADSTRAALEAARPYPDGRWLYLEVDDAEVVDDIKKLVVLKSPPPRR